MKKRLEIKNTGWPTLKLNLKQSTTLMKGKDVNRYFRQSMYDMCSWIFIRISMEQSRLSTLAMLSIDKSFIKTIPNLNEEVIDNFAMQKDRRMDFIYKSRYKYL